MRNASVSAKSKDSYALSLSKSQDELFFITSLRTVYPVFTGRRM